MLTFLHTTVPTASCDAAQNWERECDHFFLSIGLMKGKSTVVRADGFKSLVDNKQHPCLR